MLHELGMPSHIKGYQYIRTAITMVYDNPDIVGGITKELYPELWLIGLILLCLELKGHC